MKQADLEVGGEYAFVTYTRPDGTPVAARVRLAVINGHGTVTVQVVDPGLRPPERALDARAMKRGENLQVRARALVCTWGEWPERAAAITAEVQERSAGFDAQRHAWERRLADRVLVDPGRVLPKVYPDEDDDLDDGEERDALTAAYVKARDLGPYANRAALHALLADLPVLVVRDIIAAAGSRNEPGVASTVSATFARAARCLDAARHPNSRALHPNDLLGDVDVAFLEAVGETFVAAGAELDLPAVPPLPSWADEYYRETERPIVVQSLGWLRVAVGDTNRGDRLHSVDCRNIRSRPIGQVDHVPWWFLVLEGQQRLCGVCGGPGLRDLQALTGFVAAVDVWHDRGAGQIEQWQQVAALRLVAATSTARAGIAEADVTLAARVVTALATGTPGEVGWVAYALMAGNVSSRREQSLKQFAPQQQTEARKVVRNRLAAVEAVLPESMRSQPLPPSADLTVLQERYAQLHELLDNTVPQLDRLLFTLPAVR